MIKITELNHSNYVEIAKLAFKLWPNSTLKDETQFFSNCSINKSQSAFLLSVDSASIGFVYASLRNDFVEGTKTKPVCYVEGIYIEPKFRKKGYAAGLMKEVENWGKLKGCKEIASDAEIKNLNSIEFHKRIGFKEVNRVACFAKVIN